MGQILVIAIPIIATGIMKGCQTETHDRACDFKYKNNEAAKKWCKANGRCVYETD